MAYDVTYLKAGIRARGFETDTAGQQLIFLNQVQRDVLGEHRWRFMLVTANVAAVIGQAPYLLPTSQPLRVIESIRFVPTGGNQYGEMDWLDTEELLELAAYNASSPAYAGAPPVYWTDSPAASFTVYPAPTVAGNFVVRYLRTATELTADASVPEIPFDYQDILVAGTCELLANRERQWDAAKAFGAERERRTAAMKGQLGLRQRQTSERVRNSGTYSYGYRRNVGWGG